MCDIEAGYEGIKTEELANLRKENKALKLQLSGRTYCHSDEKVEEELKALQECLAESRRLTKELDVACFGENAAKQASLCDLVKIIPDHIEALQEKVKEQHETWDANFCAMEEVALANEKRAEQAEERLRVEQACNRCGEYHGKEACADVASMEVILTAVRKTVEWHKVRVDIRGKTMICECRLCHSLADYDCLDKESIR